MSLRELREMILDADHPEKFLQLADDYLLDMELKGENFILPREHAAVRPILEHYFQDLPGWVKFVKGVRDRLPSRSEAQQEVHKVYRTILIRLTQQERRARLSRAVATAVKKRMIPDDYQTKLRYANRCTQAWKLRRDRMLDTARRMTTAGRLTAEEREELLVKFWAGVDAEIKNGELPKP